MRDSLMAANVWHYGELPISKHFPIKLHRSLIRAETLKPALQRQLTIARVGGLLFFIIDQSVIHIFLAIACQSQKSWV